MKLEDYIQSKKFQSEWHKATVNVLFTNKVLVKELENRASRAHITLQQFNVLRILRGQFPNPASNLLVKQRMISSTPDISRLIDRLVSKNLVSRKQSSKDKRAVSLLITEEGLQLLEELETDMTLHDILTDNLTEDEARTLNHLLDKMKGDKWIPSNHDCAPHGHHDHVHDVRE